MKELFYYSFNKQTKKTAKTDKAMENNKLSKSRMSLYTFGFTFDNVNGTIMVQIFAKNEKSAQKKAFSTIPKEQQRHYVSESVVSTPLNF